MIRQTCIKTESQIKTDEQEDRQAYKLTNSINLLRLIDDQFGGILKRRKKA